MEPLSVVIITYNEARNIGRCLESVRPIATEIVVLDSFSTDATRAICARFGVSFFEHAFYGHIEQKNRALELASHEWVLCLDADEALSPTLQESISACLKANACAGYKMNRLTHYCGKWIRHSGWYPDQKLRLFRRRVGRWGGENPHDKIVLPVGSSVGRLKGDLWHFSYYTRNEHRERAILYARIAARARYRSGKPSLPASTWMGPILRFLKHFVLKCGFLDGRAGWHIAWISAMETRMKYRQLHALRRADRDS
jgi:glycosyltransferase involved in cell wall biosynthesis